MQVIADLQLHSKYARAVSPKMDLPEIARWASKKGIQLAATGDWQHPEWFKHIQENLIETSPGIFRLKTTPPDVKHNVKFLLSSEISSIFTQGGHQRRIHNLIFSPSLETCENVIKALKKRGCNLAADGRPIVGLSSTELLKLLLDIDERIMMIPAHVWTPWFGHFGSKSGFDSLQECFGDYAKYIYAIETGLSSDPHMNWQIKELENRSIVSFSDAHSGPKMGREATVFETKDENYSYDDIAKAIKRDPDAKMQIGYTIEFFPQEGKYHWSGHRNCQIRYSPEEIKTKGDTCPVCGRPLTIGVENRILDLSQKHYTSQELTYEKNDVGVTFVYDKNKKRKPFVSLIPLQEILVEIHNGSPTKGLRAYEELIHWATEFDILLHKSYDEIEKQAGSTLQQAVQIMRERRAYIEPGYDGVYGTVKIFKNGPPKEHEEPQTETLF